MLPLTGVSLGVGLDLVAECAAHTPGGITLLRRGALVEFLGHRLTSLRLRRGEPLWLDLTRYTREVGPLLGGGVDAKGR